MDAVALFASLFVVVSVCAYHLFQLTMVIAGALELRLLRVGDPQSFAKIAASSGELPAVSIVVPAFNEEAAIVRTVQSLLSLTYPQFEVIVVSDGSNDHTLPVLHEQFDLAMARDESARDLVAQRVHRAYRSARDGRLMVLDKGNGGKADALNAGINLARYPLILAVDADVVLLPDALIHLAVPFVTHPETVATSGMIRPQNGCTIKEGKLIAVDAPRRWLERIQVVEYLRAYGIGRMFFNRVGAQLIISGAFGLFSRQLLLDVGGYQTHAVGEDMELVVRIHRHLRHRRERYRIGFAPDALCLTEAPHTMRELGQQRTRWHHGLLSTLRLHSPVVGRRAYGAVGLFAAPYFVAELLFPLVELFGWLGLPMFYLFGLLSAPNLLIFGASAMLMSATVSLAALAVDSSWFSFFPTWQSRGWLAISAVGEQLGYRQCTVYYRLRAFVRYYRNVQLRTSWRSPSRLTPPQVHAAESTGAGLEHNADKA